MRFLILVTVLFGLTACAKNVEYNVKMTKDEPLKFVQNKTAFKFMDGAYPEGSRFELVKTEDGRQVAIIGLTTHLFDRYNHGFVLDDGMCTTDLLLTEFVSACFGKCKHYSISSSSNAIKIPSSLCFADM